MDQQTIDIIKSCAPALKEHGQAITQRMYDLIFEANPQVQLMFDKARMQSGKQQKALAGAIVAVAENIDRLDALDGAIDAIALRHVQSGVEPEHYPVVDKYLLQAIADVLGDAIDQTVIDAWAQVYGELAKVFIDRERMQRAAA